MPDRLQVEREGILAWAVQGCLAWQRHGLGLPDEVKAATEQYRADMDLLGGFIADCCVVREDAQATSAALYERYVAWAHTAGENQMSQKALGITLAERGFTPTHEHGARGWLGIGLRGQEAIPF